MLTLDDVALYPLFTPEVLSLMRRVLPDDTRQHIATSVIVRARKPAARIPKAAVSCPDASALVQRLDDVAAVEAGGVTVRPLKRVDEVELTVLDIEPGHTTPFHSHSHAHRGIVMTGTGTLQLTGRDYRSHRATCSRSHPTSPTPSRTKAPDRCGWCAWTASSTQQPDDRVGDLLHRRRKAMPLTGLVLVGARHVEEVQR